MNNVCIDGGTLTDAMRSLIGSAARAADAVMSKTSPVRRVGKAKRAHRRVGTAHRSRACPRSALKYAQVGQARPACAFAHPTAHNTRGMRFIARSSGERSERFHRAALRAEIGPLVERQRAIDLPILEREVMCDREVFF